ncbi:MAG: hypothetical protein AAB217_01475, partial [Chloroflexota bacterium]
MTPQSTPRNPSGSSFQIDVVRRGTSAVVTLVGSCEMLEAERMMERMVELADESTQVIVIDMSR